IAKEMVGQVLVIGDPHDVWIADDDVGSEPLLPARAVLGEKDELKIRGGNDRGGALAVEDVLEDLHVRRIARHRNEVPVARPVEARREGAHVGGHDDGRQRRLHQRSDDSLTSQGPRPGNEHFHDGTCGARFAASHAAWSTGNGGRLGIVARPAGVAPARARTARAVRTRILASRKRLQWSTYQTSRANRSSQSTAFRPWTTAHPVMPGRTSCRLRSSCVYRSRYFVSNGRGPPRLRSPRTTFRSCGNSSMLVVRRNWPRRLNRCSSGRSSPSSPRASFIVLSLMISNVFSWKPTRV